MGPESKARVLLRHRRRTSCVERRRGARRGRRGARRGREERGAAGAGGSGKASPSDLGRPCHWSDWTGNALRGHSPPCGQSLQPPQERLPPDGTAATGRAVGITDLPGGTPAAHTTGRPPALPSSGPPPAARVSERTFSGEGRASAWGSPSPPGLTDRTPGQRPCGPPGSGDQEEAAGPRLGGWHSHVEGLEDSCPDKYKAVTIESTH